MRSHVSARLNDQGGVVSTDLYDAYGSLRDGNSNSDPVGYCGQWGYYTDHSTGYILCTFRWYEPMTARWLTRDPIGYSGGMNLYGYVGGNPVGAVDPLGLDKIIFWGKTLQWVDEKGREVMSTPAVSGQPGAKPSDQSKPKYGPIPEGLYQADPGECQQGTDDRNLARDSPAFYWYTLSPKSAWGDTRVEVHPQPNTCMFGRSGFYIHGGDLRSSAGCIDVGHENRRWTNALLTYNKPITLVVDYSQWDGSNPPEEPW